MTIKFTRLISNHGPLTKRFYLENDGNLQKEAAAQLYRGKYQVESVSGLPEFVNKLEMATQDTAFTYGVTDQAYGQLVREEDLPNKPLAIARTRKFFSWPSGPAFLMIDDDSGLITDDFADFLWETVPLLNGVEMIVRPSSSSMIINTETKKWMRLEGNRRAYVVISDGRMIPEVGRLIESFLWLSNSGYYDVSKSGRLLKRCPADISVWAPERLDFVGGAVCAPPLAQHALRAEVIEGHLAMLDTRHLPKLSDRDKAKIQEHELLARQLVEEERNEAVKAYTAERREELVRRGVDPDSAQATIQSAINRQILTGDFVLTLQDGTTVSVCEMLARPEQYDGKRCHDPLEPGYRDDPRVAYISLRNGGQPYIYSHAHGGCWYKLKRPAKTIQVMTGESAKGADEIAVELSRGGILYERGQLLVTLQSNGETREAKAATVKYLAASHCNLQRFDSRSRSLRPTDLTDAIAQLILTRTGQGIFRNLTAVITAPSMTASGRLISSPGYDKETGLLLFVINDEEPPRLPRQPTSNEIQDAFDQLWFPFKEFPFNDDDNRSAMVAALLTAVVRPCLVTSPGFGFDAPTAASGKTKLAQCVAALATGKGEALLPPPTDDEETRKKIATALAATKQVMIFDNIETQLKSPVLAAFLTASTWSDRMLGGNTEIQAENRILLLLTGNNLNPVGDIVRRLLMIRIDPQLEVSQVWQREFCLEPLDYVIRNRQKLVCAALTLLAGFVAAGMPRMVKGRLASFEQWDDLVRQCVIWLGTKGIGNLKDPVKRLNDAAANDPESLRLGILAEAWHTKFGNTPKLLKDVLSESNLNDILMEVAQDRRGLLNVKILGSYLSKRVGKIVSGYKFERQNGRSNTSLWRVMQTQAGDGFGGFGGVIPPHSAQNKKSFLNSFSGTAEIDPSNPPLPPECLRSSSGSLKDDPGIPVTKDLPLTNQLTVTLPLENVSLTGF
jgi:hypothetical protein